MEKFKDLDDYLNKFYISEDKEGKNILYYLNNYSNPKTLQKETVESKPYSNPIEKKIELMQFFRKEKIDKIEDMPYSSIISKKERLESLRKQKEQQEIFLKLIENKIKTTKNTVEKIKFQKQFLKEVAFSDQITQYIGKIEKEMEGEIYNTITLLLNPKETTALKTLEEEGEYISLESLQLLNKFLKNKLDNNLFNLKSKLFNKFLTLSKNENQTIIKKIENLIKLKEINTLVDDKVLEEKDITTTDIENLNLQTSEQLEFLEEKIEENEIKISKKLKKQIFFLTQVFLKIETKHYAPEHLEQLDTEELNKEILQIKQVENIKTIHSEKISEIKKSLIKRLNLLKLSNQIKNLKKITNNTKTGEYRKSLEGSNIQEFAQKISETNSLIKKAKENKIEIPEKLLKQINLIEGIVILNKMEELRKRIDQLLKNSKYILNKIDSIKKLKKTQNFFRDKDATFLINLNEKLIKILKQKKLNTYYIYPLFEKVNILVNEYNKNFIENPITKFKSKETLEKKIEEIERKMEDLEKATKLTSEIKKEKSEEEIQKENEDENELNKGIETIKKTFEKNSEKELYKLKFGGFEDILEQDFFDKFTACQKKASFRKNRFKKSIQKKFQSLSRKKELATPATPNSKTRKIPLKF